MYWRVMIACNLTIEDCTAYHSEDYHRRGLFTTHQEAVRRLINKRVAIPSRTFKLQKQLPDGTWKDVHR